VSLIRKHAAIKNKNPNEKDIGFEVGNEHRENITQVLGKRMLIVFLRSGLRVMRKH
jgi:hypothetical protein